MKMILGPDKKNESILVVVVKGGMRLDILDFGFYMFRRLRI